MKWKLLILIAAILELTALTLQFGIPAIGGRVFGDPKFPHLIAFHGQAPPSDIVDFRGNFYHSAVESSIFCIVVVFGIALVAKLSRRVLQEDIREFKEHRPILIRSRGGILCFY